MTTSSTSCSNFTRVQCATNKSAKTWFVSGHGAATNSAGSHSTVSHRTNRCRTIGHRSKPATKGSTTPATRVTPETHGTPGTLVTICSRSRTIHTSHRKPHVLTAQKPARTGQGCQVYTTAAAIFCATLYRSRPLAGLFAWTITATVSPVGRWTTMFRAAFNVPE